MANCGTYNLTKIELHKRFARALYRRGFTVCETSVKKKTDATRNTPDIFVYAGTGRWIGVFFQSKCNKLTDDQQKLVDEEKAILITNIDEQFVSFAEMIKTT